jgi:hypothetical protein
LERFGKINNYFNQQKTMSKNLIITAVVAVAVLGVIISYPKLMPKEEGVVNQINQTETEQQAVSEPEPQATQEAPMANWRTYTNEEFGFEVKYPGEWRIDEDGSGSDTFPRWYKFKVSGFSEDNYLFIEINNPAFGLPIGGPIKKDTFQVQNGIFERSFFKGFIYANASYKDDDFFVWFGCQESVSECESTFNQILSTFRFID